MPKVHKKSSNKPRLSPYNGKSRIKRSGNCKKTNGKRLCYEKEKDQWEESRCPICMDRPHNAVLLICSSHEKGCRPYMCDTSNLLSNCFDQFCNLHSVIPSKSKSADQQNKFVGNGEKGCVLVCPLCRGQVRGWIVVKGARKLMNKMVRGCTVDSCDFSGNYAELKKHAMVDHPSARPSQVDSDQKQNFQNILDDREQEFLVQRFGNDQEVEFLENNQDNNMSDDVNDEDLERNVFGEVELILCLDDSLPNYDDFASDEEILTEEYSARSNGIIQYTRATNVRRLIEYYMHVLDEN